MSNYKPSSETYPDWDDVLDIAWDQSTPTLDKISVAQGVTPQEQTEEEPQHYVLYDPVGRVYYCHLCGKPDQWVHYGEEFSEGYFECAHGVVPGTGLRRMATVAHQYVSGAKPAAHWECPRCGGVGWLYIAGAVDQFGNPVKIACPQCQGWPVED